jgi:hypothetical protein
MGDTYDLLAARVAKLERTSAAWRLAALVSLGVAVAVVAGSGMAAPKKLLKLNELQIVDSQGVARITLGSNGGEPKVFMEGTKKERSISIGMVAGEPQIRMTGAPSIALQNPPKAGDDLELNFHPVAVQIDASDTDGPTISLRDAPSDSGRILISAFRNEPSRIFFYDATGAKVAIIPDGAKR